MSAKGSTRHLSRKILRITSEVSFLGLFVLLARSGGLQRWLLVFGAGAILSIFVGRIYCGFVCPMETLFQPIGWAYRKLGIKRLEAPGFVKHRFVRYLTLTALIATMVVTRMLKIKVNVLLYVVGIAVVVTLFFTDELWHRYLCPYGTILSFLSRGKLLGVRIGPSKCTGCGACEKVCPAVAIEQVNGGAGNDKAKPVRTILPRECISGYRCQDACPVDAITGMSLNSRSMLVKSVK